MESRAIPSVDSGPPTARRRETFADVLNLPVYLDNHATTRTDPRVVEAMLPYFTTIYGNAASVSHRFGWDAAAAVDRAREQVAALIGAEPREIVFTSGATEANNLALKGVVAAPEAQGEPPRHRRDRAQGGPRPAASGWRAKGGTLTIVPPDADGLVSAEAIAAALTDRTVLVSVMAANNEVGTLNPIAAIGRLCHERGIVFHTDATQAVGKIPLDVQRRRRSICSASPPIRFTAQGDRRPVRPPPRPAGAADAAVRRRRPRARVPERDGRRPAGRRPGRGRRARRLASATAEAARLLELRDRLHAGIADAGRRRSGSTAIRPSGCRAT